MSSFNSFIENVELQDLPLTNGLYTWSDFWETPTLTLIDRFLASKDFLSKFQNATVKRLNRPTLDHYPLHLSFGLAKWGPSPFRFENAWLQHHSFKPLVEHSPSRLVGERLYSKTKEAESNLKDMEEIHLWQHYPTKEQASLRTYPS